MLWKVMGQRAGVAGKSLQIPMQILLPVMAERRKEDWVGRDFVQREFWGLRPANGEPQKNVCLLKETNAGQERLSLSAPTMRSWARAHAIKVMLNILQARLQQYVNWEIPDVQAGFRKCRGIRDPIANIHWIIVKAREFRKTFTSSITTLKPLTV